MKVSTILDHIDNGHMALPEFQRGYVWNREQVRGLFDSLYKQHPVGSLLVWATQSDGAPSRGGGQLAPGVVKLLLDGQQRITSLYGVVRGMPPAFFDGNAQSFTGLCFHLGNEQFEFYQPIKMKDDPLWIDVSKLLQQGDLALGQMLTNFSMKPELLPKMPEFAGRLSRILNIRNIELHIEEVTGKDKTIDVVVDIFNKVNSGGTKLSKGDLALAKICSEWPEARNRMKKVLKVWSDAGFHFDVDWLLRNMNTIISGEAKFQFLHDVTPAQVEDGLERSTKSINHVLNLISGRLGLDHNQVFFGRFAVPVMVHYHDKKKGLLDSVESDKLLFWYVQAAMWGRFSASTESTIDQDLAAIEDPNGALDRLIGQLRLWHGGLRVEPGHFSGWSLGARFYPVLYMLTRVGTAKDWGTGLPLKSSLLGKMNTLEVHHIFPKARLYKNGLGKSDVNAVANFCFLTKTTNLNIGDNLPQKYFAEIEEKHPGALASQWIPMDPYLWKIENYEDFLSARREILAEATNQFMLELLHGDDSLLSMPEPSSKPQAPPEPMTILGTVDNADEERELLDLRQWVVDQGLAQGCYMYELTDPKTGSSSALLDLAWPNGLQEGLGQPVALLLNEGPDVLALASSFGFRCYTNVPSFKHHVLQDVLAEKTT